MALDSSLPTQSLLGPMAVEQVINILSYDIKIAKQYFHSHSIENSLFVPSYIYRLLHRSFQIRIRFLDAQHLKSRIKTIIREAQIALCFVDESLSHSWKLIH